MAQGIVHTPHAREINGGAWPERVSRTFRFDVTADLTRAAVELRCSAAEVAVAVFAMLFYRHSQQFSAPMYLWQRNAHQQSKQVPFGFGNALPVHFRVSNQATLSSFVADLAASATLESRGEEDIRGRLVGISLCEPLSKPSQTRLLAAEILINSATVTVSLWHDTATYSSEGAAELLSQYETLVEQATRATSKGLLEHSLVTVRCRSLLGDPTVPIKKARPPLLAESFVSWVEHHPAHIAVRYAGRTWSYVELERQSAAIALRLHEAGVRNGDVVAVTGARSYGTVATMLAIFRLGAVLLTLDPKLPSERKRLMIAQANAISMVCIGGPLEADPVCERILYIDQCLTNVMPREGLGIADLAPVAPDAPAYVFFTSGSTGTPKSVLGTHEGLGHFLEWQRQTFKIGPDDRASQLTALSFDVLLRDAFLALTSGATLCIPDESDILNPPAILRWMQAEAITVTHIVPSLARSWVAHAPKDLALPKLKFVFFAGEPLTDVLVTRFRETFSTRPTIINLYGPTETTLAKCWYQIGDPDPGVQPIGDPIDGAEIYILDGDRQLCGINEIGEIAIRTPFRTRGYLNSPEANAYAFVPNPFTNDPTDAFYLTGDQGRLRPDGRFEIRGRLDNQIKIRGMRVELGEIEYALCRLDGVRDAAVLAVDSPALGKRLVAYVVLDASSRSDSTQIRTALSGVLPEHMIPGEFVRLDELPLNANGKVNRKALADVRTSSASVELPMLVKPKTSLEGDIAMVWQAAVGHTRVGVDDSFGTVGGDSLSAIDALIAMTKLGVSETAAKGIFEGRTIREIASALPATTSTGERIFTDSSVVARALSIVLVVIEHFQHLHWQGFTDILFFVSGMSLARFQLQSIAVTGSVFPMLKLMGRIALPTLLWILLIQFCFTGLHWQSLAFIDNYVSPNFNGGNTVWFIELLLQMMAVITLVLAFPTIRRLAVNEPYAFGVSFLICAMCVMVIGALTWDTSALYNRVFYLTLPTVVAGWCAAYSQTLAAKIFTAGLLLCSCILSGALLGTATFAPLLGCLAVILVPAVPIPFGLSRVVNLLAGSSLFIYLTHYQVRSVADKLLNGVSPMVGAVLALAGGVVIWRLWQFSSRAVARFTALTWPKLSTARSTGPASPSA